MMEKKKADICRVFPFLTDHKKHIVSLVGAGGKTTTMYSLAEAAAECGRNVLVTTTTHIVRPKSCVMAENESELFSLWKQGRYAVMGRAETDKKETAPEKLSALTTEELRHYCQLADLVLIEADGAKRMPCKVPESHEPVILPETDIVIGVMGMDCIGQALCNVCFRKEAAVSLLGVDSSHVMQPLDLAEILTSRQGTRKNVEDREYYILLNKCDNDVIKRRALETAELLKARGEERIVLGSMGQFTHFDGAGNARMVDIHEKDDTYRVAVARGKIYVNEAVFQGITDKTVKKGDVLSVARVAGIMGAKKNAELIPLCHAIAMTDCEITFSLSEKERSITVVCKAACIGKTGVEMEAMTGVSVALLTIYDMCKALDRGMRITDIELLEKDGGKSGHYKALECE